MSATGDYTLGRPFLANSPECVAQVVYTRLRLWQGEWFLDLTEGTPYLSGVLGERHGKNPDAAIRARILGTPGVTAIVSYSSSFDPATRKYTVNCEITTQYSADTVTVPQIELITPTTTGT